MHQCGTWTRQSLIPLVLLKKWHWKRGKKNEIPAFYKTSGGRELRERVYYEESLRERERIDVCADRRAFRRQRLRPHPSLLTLFTMRVSFETFDECRRVMRRPYSDLSARACGRPAGICCCCCCWRASRADENNESPPPSTRAQLPVVTGSI